MYIYTYICINKSIIQNIKNWNIKKLQNELQNDVFNIAVSLLIIHQTFSKNPLIWTSIMTKRTCSMLNFMAYTIHTYLLPSYTSFFLSLSLSYVFFFSTSFYLARLYKQKQSCAAGLLWCTQREKKKKGHSEGELGRRQGSFKNSFLRKKVSRVGFSN